MLHVTQGFVYFRCLLAAMPSGLDLPSPFSKHLALSAPRCLQLFCEAGQSNCLLYRISKYDCYQGRCRVSPDRSQALAPLQLFKFE